jgi:hypothetical protein
MYCNPHENIFRVIKSRKIRQAGHAARMEDRRDTQSVMMGNLERKRTLGRPRRRREDNIKMDLQEVRCEEWTGSSWHRIETGGGKVCRNKPLGSIKCR